MTKKFHFALALCHPREKSFFCFLYIFSLLLIEFSIENQPLGIINAMFIESWLFQIIWLLSGKRVFSCFIKTVKWKINVTTVWMCNYKKDLEHLLNSELPYYLSGDQKTDISQILIQHALKIVVCQRNKIGPRNKAMLAKLAVHFP